jgi:hypothetical protein
MRPVPSGKGCPDLRETWERRKNMASETSGGMDWSEYTAEERLALAVVLAKIREVYDPPTPQVLLKHLRFFLWDNRVPEAARAAFASGLEKLGWEYEGNLWAWLAHRPRADRAVSEEEEAQAQAKLEEIRRRLEAVHLEAGEIREELEECEARLAELKEKARRELEEN